MKLRWLGARSTSRSRNPSTPTASLPNNELRVSGDPHSDNCDPDVEIVPNSMEERHGASDTVICPESLNLYACIVCGIIDERVSTCFGIDCPISFHGKCVTDEPDDKEASNPYCPYCWFKIQVMRSYALREKAVAAEKALSRFLEEEMNGGCKEDSGLKSQEKKRILSDGEGCEDLEKGFCPSRERQLQMGKDSEKIRDDFVQLNGSIEQSVDLDGQLKECPNQPRGQHMEPDEKVLEPEKDKQTEDEERIEMNEETASNGVEALESEEWSGSEKFLDAEDRNKLETIKDQPKEDRGTEITVEGSPFMSIQESFSKDESEQVQSNWRQKRERKYKGPYSDISSGESTNEPMGQDFTEQSNSSFKTPSRRVTSGLGKTENQKRKSKREASSGKSDKRKRMPWTEEEEAMLRVGVETYAGEVSKNMPWRKILEMGEKVFHETRTPTDLKDKWRSIHSPTKT